MMKKCVFLFLALLLCVSLTISVSAESAEGFVFDGADLLTDAEETALNEKLEHLSETYEAQVLVVTVEAVTEEELEKLADNTYDENNFGYGENRDGVLLVVCMQPRECQLLTEGFAFDAIDSGDVESVLDVVAPELSDGNYAGAFDAFVGRCEYYLDGHINGFPFKFGRNLVIALIIGIAAGAIVAFSLKGQLKSVHKQDRASVYVKPDSMRLDVSRDLFLYRNVTRTKKESSSSSSGSGSSRNVGRRSF